MPRRWWILAAGAVVAAALAVLVVRSAGTVDAPPKKADGAETGGGMPPPVFGPPVPGALPEGMAAFPPEERLKACMQLAANGGWEPPLFRYMAEDAGTYPLLLAQLRDGATRDERALALLVLSQGETEEIDRIMREAARGTYGDDLKVAAVLALGRRHPARAIPLLSELLDLRADPAVYAAAYRGLFPVDSATAIEKTLAQIDAAGTDEDKGRLWMALMGIVPDVAHGLPEGFRGPPFDLRPTMSPALLADEALGREVMERVRAERDPKRRLMAFRVAASLPGEEAERLTFELFDEADTETRLQYVRNLGPAGATRRMLNFFVAAPRIPEPEVRRALAREATAWMFVENVPELQAWRNVETDPEACRFLDETIERLSPR